MQNAPEYPPRGPDAFTSMDDDSIQAQAAILLGIGAQLRGDRQKVEARSVAVAHPTAIMTDDELEEFPIPRLAPARKRYSIGELDSAVRARFGVSMFGAAADEPERRLPQMAAAVYETQRNSAAAALAEACMEHQHALVRVAAANAALPITTRPELAIATLAENVMSDDELVRDVAATSLARYMPEHPALRQLDSEDGHLLAFPAETSMLIHGTWARNNSWYQPPAGNFWRYIKTNVWPDLYANPDFYKWSGGYSDGARDLAADQLVTWITNKNENGISLMCHSHGGSAAMLATWRGVTLGRLVLLSCPVHPAKYSANFAAVQKVTSIRVKGDLVLLADGSGSRFTDPRYNEHVLPIWFNHSATHDPARWTQFNIPAML